MTNQRERQLPRDDMDAVEMRTGAEVSSRIGIAQDHGTRLSAVSTLTEGQLSLPSICSLIGIEAEEMYALVTSGKPVVQEKGEVIDKLYTIGALVWKECEEFSDNFQTRIAAAKAILEKPTFHLKTDPKDPSSKDRSMIQAIRDGDYDRVLLMADMQLGDPKD